MTCTHKHIPMSKDIDTYPCIYVYMLLNIYTGKYIHILNIYIYT